ncbi:hypothetical protein MHPYR_90154 [uncultured Mycobacterium sp.]|uniref:Uncharacterized protein n=1 Tax=uncultured Mycobacterium sp. TaxID=171292 RepID=A0A1Y5PMB8_9MYCO|nr:hypothetical protein MHPYR_90154 [uncultured Mycobacterium sp.]
MTIAMPCSSAASRIDWSRCTGIVLRVPSEYRTVISGTCMALFLSVRFGRVDPGQTIADTGFLAMRALSRGMTSSASSRMDSFHGPGLSR